MINIKKFLFKNTRRLLLISLVMVMLGANVWAKTPSVSDIQQQIDLTSDYLLSAVPTPKHGAIGGEWTVFGLVQNGVPLSKDYVSAYTNALLDKLSTTGNVLNKRKITDNARAVIALKALGENPENFHGYNLLEPLCDTEQAGKQGLNGIIWSLIALDGTAYGSQDTRLFYVNALVEAQHKDGAWALSAKANADADITAMALTALAPYQTETSVQTAVDDALTYLSSVQQKDGGFTDSCESSAQVLVAFQALGISFDDARFVKNGHTVLAHFLDFAKSDGSFEHIKKGGADLMATEQSLYALCAVKRSLTGGKPLFNLTDSLIGKHRDVAVPKPLRAYTPFDDVRTGKEAVEALYIRGICNGTSSTRFSPEAPVTRCEFAAFCVRALGLKSMRKRAFDDVKPTDWFYEPVLCAAQYTLVNGVGHNLFAPHQAITLEQACVMLTRLATLLGLDTRLQTPLKNGLQQPSPWAEHAYAYFYKQGFLSAFERMSPQAPLSRIQTAELLYRVLRKADEC